MIQPDLFKPRKEDCELNEHEQDGRHGNHHPVDLANRSHGRWGSLFEFREGLSGELGRGNATLSMGDDDGDDTVTVHGTKAQEFAEFEQAITFVSCQLPMTDGFSGTDREHPATVVWVFDRFDGRGLADVRQIKCEVGVLPRTHGSALFTRGETQALVVTTLGMTDDEQRLESLEGMQRSNFMLHYNFPPFSVGECGRIGTGRREIGHGKLAWRAINSSLPSKENFPYTLRVVSEITESNGSSSMATVCGTSLSLMDAGVPIKEPVAGIAMGLIKEGEDFSVLSDILGDEDHLGDMDFKVAGTKSGITSLQMDIKITGITFEIMEKALDQAKDGREHILGEMNKAIKTSRKEFSKHTPKMETIKVDKKEIATVIGKGGATIREIVETSGAKVDVKDTGEVTVAAPDEASRNKAIEFIKNLIAKPEMGKIYKGKVVKIMEFGAFVNFLGKQDGLVHISELADKRVAKVGDVVKEGDEVSVKVVGFDRGKVKLSMKQASA